MVVTAHEAKFLIHVGTATYKLKVDRPFKFSYDFELPCVHL